jgi:hypothetical protein
MSVSSCVRCGKVINGGSIDICESCVEIENDEFQKIKYYIEVNPGATVFQVTTALDISVKNIKRYLRESRLEVADRDAKSNSFLTCIKCGVSIRSGYYCMNCATSVQCAKAIESPIRDQDSSKSPQKTGIHFSQKDTKRT